MTRLTRTLLAGWVLGLLLGLLAIPGYATERYVAKTGCSDSNNGSQGAPYCTIAKGLSVTNPGDTLWIRQGTYDEEIHATALNVGIKSGTSWTNAVTIAGYPGETATVRAVGMDNVVSPNCPKGCPHSSDPNATYCTEPSLTGHSYMIFDNLTIQYGMGTSWDSHHIRLSNSNVMNFSGSNVQQGGGIFNEFLNNKFSGAASGNYGTYYWGRQSLFDGNEFFNNGGYGVHLFLSCQDIVRDNVFKNNYVHHNGDGQHAAGGMLISSGPGNQAYNNVIVDNWSGLEVNYRCHNCTAYNNTIFRNTNNSLDIGASWFSNDVRAQGNIIANNGNNTIVIAGGSTGAVTTPNLTSTPPQFTNPAGGQGLAARNGFQLQSSSPARNFYPLGASGCFVSTDAINFGRPSVPVGGSANPCDAGAFEYNEGTTSCPAACPGTCINPTTCPPPPSGQPTGNPIYLSVGGYGDTPSDSGPCTNAENINTPRATFAAAMACMQVAGKVLYIRGGTYAAFLDTLTTPIVGGIAADNSTRIEGYGSETVTLQLPTGQTTLLHLRNSDQYVTIRKLTLDAMTRTGSRVMRLLGTNKIRLEEVELRNADQQALLAENANNTELGGGTKVHHSGNGQEGIKLQGTIDGFLMQGVDVYQNAGHGIGWGGGELKRNITLRESTFRSNGVTGVDVGVSEGATLQNLLIFNNVGLGVRIRGGAEDTRLYNATVYNNTSNGVMCDAGATGVEVKNILAWGNTPFNLVNNCGATVAKNWETPDPVFVSVTPGAEDFHLAPGSPAIDQGDPIAGLTIDFAGDSRLNAGPWDPGAYRAFQVTPPTPPTTVLEVVQRYLGMWY